MRFLLSPRELIAVAITFALLANSGEGATSALNSASLLARDYNIPQGWTNVSQSSTPPAMAGQMMAYSSKDHRFVLFGGWDGARGLNETWVFDSENRTWTELQPPLSPIERGDEMFVYDDQADVFILFGGWYEFPNGTYTRLSDTWTFALSTGTWTERHPARSPSPRSDAEVAYDPAAGAVLLVGGFSGATYLGDTWMYSLANDTWTPRPGTIQPSPRADGRMVYVPTQDRFILFGGNDYSGPNFTFHHLADTWSYDWNSDTWTAIMTAVAPPARDYPVLVVDVNADSLLLTSGYADRTILNDLWGFSLRGDGWSDLTAVLSPPARFAGAGGFDLAGNVLVLFGGLGNDGLLADTWYYRSSPPTASPGILSSAAILGIGVLTVIILAVSIGVILFRRRRMTAAEESPEARRGPGRAP